MIRIFFENWWWHVIMQRLILCREISWHSLNSHYWLHLSHCRLLTILRVYHKMVWLNWCLLWVLIKELIPLLCLPHIQLLCKLIPGCILKPLNISCSHIWLKWFHLVLIQIRCTLAHWCHNWLHKCLKYNFLVSLEPQWVIRNLYHNVFISTKIASLKLITFYL